MWAKMRAKPWERATGKVSPDRAYYVAPALHPAQSRQYAPTGLTRVSPISQGFALIFAHIFWGLGFSPRMGAFEP